MSRRLVLVALALVLCACVPVASAQADPLILPSPKVERGGLGLLEVAAPEGATSCRISFFGHGRRYGPYDVSLGGPTRLVQWQTPGSARGTWKSHFDCRGTTRRGVSRGPTRFLGAVVAKLVVGRRGSARGHLLRAGSFRVGAGSIPEMPSEAQLSLSNLFTDDVDTKRSDERFVPCEGSKWIATTRTTGEGVGTLIQFEPTGLARAHSVLGPETAMSFESYPVYGWMWEDLNRCAHFSADMTTPQRHVMYVQMACHAYWSVASSKYTGGNTWDLEAWRKDVDWATGLAPWNFCGRNYGTVSTATEGSFLVGRIVNARAYSKPTPSEEIKAWLVLPGAPKPYRRHIATLKAYNCLAARQGKAQWFPHQFLESYVDVSRSEIGDAEACSSQAPGPIPPSGGGSAPPPTPGAPPPPPQVWVEQQGSLGANTFTNPYNASGMGVKIQPYAYVEVSCKLYAPQILSANPDGYWYRIHSAPWSDAYYAVANTFWNGDVPGQKPYVHNTDFAVPDC